MAELTLTILFLLFAITIHESAHAWMAFRLGDPTAQREGRISLNPIRHIDFFWSILLPLTCLLPYLMGAGSTPFIFGGGKPVPVNPYNFRDPRKDSTLVSLAGPASNLILALLVILLMIPAKSFLGEGSFSLLYILIFQNVFLGAFNLIPIPPLDGSRVLQYFLRGRLAHSYAQIVPYGLLILLLVLSSNLHRWFILPFYHTYAWLLQVLVLH